MATPDKIPPSEESRQDLNRLSEDFKPNDVKFLVALDSHVSLEECTENVSKTIGALKKYVNSPKTKQDEEDAGFSKVTKY